MEDQSSHMSGTDKTNGQLLSIRKMGYHQTGKTEMINDKLTLVFYKKD